MITCSECNQECCKSVVIEIDAPETLRDWEDIKWKVVHENLRVIFDNDNSWCVEFLTMCKHLEKDGKCGIYSKRPKMCREHDFEACILNGEGEYYKIILEDIGDVEKYLAENPGAIKGKKKK